MNRRGLGMLDVAFDLIFEQHLLGLDDKLGVEKTRVIGGRFAEVFGFLEPKIH